jgi:hypothetical protein
VTTVDIEAIRARSHAVGAAIDVLTVAPNPAHAARAHAAAVASAEDVPPLLAELEEARRELGRLRAELHDARFGCEGAEHG